MRIFLALLFLTIVSVTTLILFPPNRISRDFFLNQKVLDMSMPFDVKIDTEFLRSLKPANE